MADADFIVHVTSKHAPIAVGDQAMLEIAVTVPKTHDDVTLTWKVGWVVEGRRTNTEVVASGEHRIGRMEAGKTEELSAPFTVPRQGPVTYQGTLLSVSWFVTVSLDIDWAIDPKATFPFEVVARTVERSPRVVPSDGTHP